MPTKLSNKFQSIIFLILIIILGFTVYTNSLRGNFIWDDAGLVKNNIHIRNWFSLPQIFTKNIWAGIGEGSSVYRPLQLVTYMGDYSLWKLNVAGYHLTNILLHVLATLTLYWLVYLLFNDRIISLFSSLLFIAHPIHVEAVSYISGRADPLVTIFMLIAFACYIKRLQSKGISTWIIMLLSFILALFSRENALIIPLLLILYHYTFNKKLDIRQLWPVLGVAGIYILLRFIFLESILYDLPPETTFLQRLPGFLVAITNYIRILFLPVNLHMHYGNRLFSFLSFKAVLGVGILFSLLICAFRSRNLNRLIFFSISWFIIALLPASNLYPVNAYMAEHWLYLPSIGFFLILGKSLAYLYRKNDYKIVALACLICLVSAYSYLTIKQNIYWRSELPFIKKTLEYVPDSAILHNNLGCIYSEMGDKGGAIREYLKAIEFNPRFAYAYRNLGGIYSDGQDKEEGVRMYLKAIAINPMYAEAYNDICNTYIALGRNKEALNYCQMAIRLNSSMFTAYYNLGNAYYNLGEKDKSMEMMKKTIQLNPTYVEAYNNLASQYTETGNIDEGIRLWNESIKLKPDFATAHFNLSIFYFRAKEYNLAIRHCDKVIALGGQIDSRFLKELEPFRGKK